MSPLLSPGAQNHWSVRCDSRGGGRAARGGPRAAPRTGGRRRAGAPGGPGGVGHDRGPDDDRGRVDGGSRRRGERGGASGAQPELPRGHDQRARQLPHRRAPQQVRLRRAPGRQPHPRAAGATPPRRGPAGVPARPAARLRPQVRRLGDVPRREAATPAATAVLRRAARSTGSSAAVGCSGAASSSTGAPWCAARPTTRCATPPRPSPARRSPAPGPVAETDPGTGDRGEVSLGACARSSEWPVSWCWSPPSG